MAKAFFDNVADNIVRQLAPRTVLDAGCGEGLLVAALREHGVDARGIDDSDSPDRDLADGARAHVIAGSLTEPIEGRYDLVVSLEATQRLDFDGDAAATVANLCAAADRVLLSWTPPELDQPGPVTVRSSERWVELFASHGFFRDFRHNASYLGPWASLYARQELTVSEAVLDYEREWYRLRMETVEQRRALLDLQARCEKLQSGRDAVDKVELERDELRKEVFRLRDALIGRTAEVGTALGRVAEFQSMMHRTDLTEERLQAILASRSWRLMWVLGKPVRVLRSRGRRG